MPLRPVTTGDQVKLHLSPLSRSSQVNTSSKEHQLGHGGHHSHTNIAHDHFDKVRQHSPFLQTIYNMMCSAVPTTRKTNTVSKRQTMIPEHHVNKDPGSLQRCILPEPATATLRKLASHGGECPRDSEESFPETQGHSAPSNVM